MVKGLEFSTNLRTQSRESAEQVANSSNDQAYEGRLTGHLNRTTIDNLRVALSRATEVLAFLDVAPTDQQKALEP